LQWKRAKSEWSEYAEVNSYTDKDSEMKAGFVRKVSKLKQWNLVWDLGCNTGRFSRIAAENSQTVIAMDSDHLAVELLYQNLKKEKYKNILPLVMNLADASPGLGWKGEERKSITNRGKPDLILALALIHHVVISANIPLREFIGWLANLGADLVIEFVTKDDPMTKILLKNKEDQYADYEIDNFEKCLKEKFSIISREPLASGTRILYLCKLSC
jgi:ribosomal protein L11 methylase PrmA